MICLRLTAHHALAPFVCDTHWRHPTDVRIALVAIRNPHHIGARNFPIRKSFSNAAQLRHSEGLANRSPSDTWIRNYPDANILNHNWPKFLHQRLLLSGMHGETLPIREAGQ